MTAGNKNIKTRKLRSQREIYFHLCLCHVPCAAVQCKPNLLTLQRVVAVQPTRPPLPQLPPILVVVVMMPLPLPRRPPSWTRACCHFAEA